MCHILEKRIMGIIDDYERTKSQTTPLLTEFEELLLAKLCMAMYTIIVSLQYIQPTADFDINETVQDNLLTEVIDVRLVMMTHNTNTK